ncbi:hypothetical protein NN3_24900 [Nocardia neocaledoniensis NBRC 108232]|uniref:hypothetical protein n=1 Tax=Nocardia neocaledoniensis TaxID=236511 RepID=UPI001191BC8B|nr:hypothetical protein [Nocardia neocaledoniensis]GEM31483.1 hypothetical protein NN3_24900 [Nocardia neocaledoniensis NBRC 108232]
MSADAAYTRQLFAAAEAGTFVLTEEAARECAGHFTWYASRLTEFQNQIMDQSRQSGFGGFESAKELQAGFENKALQGYEALVRAEQVAHQLSAAIYRAAGLLEDVDAANAAALRVSSRQVGEQ